MKEIYYPFFEIFITDKVIFWLFAESKSKEGSNKLLVQGLRVRESNFQPIRPRKDSKLFYQKPSYKLQQSQCVNSASNMRVPMPSCSWESLILTPNAAMTTQNSAKSFQRLKILLRGC